MTQPSILIAVGARPNFMKAAPLLRALEATSRFRIRLVHTGQHYDPELSAFFFRDLKLPIPTHLHIGSGPPLVQINRIIQRLKPLMRRLRPDLVVVVGDVNSTAACAVAVRETVYSQGTPYCRSRRRPILAHVEAGLRSFDESMPEELNRILVDHLSDLLFAPSRDAVRHLRNEGIPMNRIFLVGNTMIDSLLQAQSRVRSSDILRRLKMEPKGYALVTLHRPSNVDDPIASERILRALGWLGLRLPIIFPIHPRTRRAWQNLPAFQSIISDGNIRLTPSLGYLDFLKLMESARVVLTDSGGIQEETTILWVPCLTLRKNTERPITLTQGTNRLAGVSTRSIIAACKAVLKKPPQRRSSPALWDGQAARRIARIFIDKIVSP